MKVSIGICAYNEGKNIGRLLQRVVRDPLIDEVIVVASGCTDNTVGEASKYPCHIIDDPERRGKAVAINQFIDRSTGDILILESADTLPSHFAFKHLLQPFDIDNVGMVGGHPIPTNTGDDTMTKIGRLLWKAHHHMAMNTPKAGEVCAFRRVIDGIDPATPVDEACIESQIVQQGLKVVYSPHAIIFNKTPTTYDDFIKQRSRIFHGHLMLRDSGYAVPSMSSTVILRAVLQASDFRHFRTLCRAMVYETLARRLALKKFKSDFSSTIWEAVNTTKELK